MSYVLPTILDLMEYANDAAAQAAFVSNGINLTSYDNAGGKGDRAASITVTSNLSNATGTAAALVTGGYSYQWYLNSEAASGKYIKFAFGSAKVITECIWYQSSAWAQGTWKWQGSNDNSNWYDIGGNFTLGDAAINPMTHTSLSANTTAYSYYMLVGISGNTDAHPWITEIEFKIGDTVTPYVQSYSEATIKQEGSYALKGVAVITGSLNKTLTRTVSPAINLTDKTIIKFNIRASRTGSNIKVGIHDSGGTTTEITPVIAAVDTWQTVVWDISAVANANKDVIDSIIVTIVNADAANTFYIDNMFGDGIWNFLVHRGRDRFRTAGYSLGN